MLEGSVAEGVARVPDGARKTLSVEHPSGEFTVELETRAGKDGRTEVTGAGLLRTSRRLFEGHVLVPARVWDGELEMPAQARGRRTEAS